MRLGGRRRAERGRAYSGGANAPSLIDARETFRRVGAVEERLAQHTRTPLPTEIPTTSPFELALTAEDVSQVRFEHALTLVFGGGATIRFETEFSLREAAGAGVRVPSDPIEESNRSLFVPVMELLGQIVSAATAFPSGELTITFDNGAAIACPPHPDFEAREYVGPDDRSIIAALRGDRGVSTQVVADHGGRGSVVGHPLHECLSAQLRPGTEHRPALLATT